MDEQFLQQLIEQYQQQNGGGNFNIPNSTTLQNNQMQPYTQNAWTMQAMRPAINTGMGNEYMGQQQFPQQGINFAPQNTIPQTVEPNLGGLFPSYTSQSDGNYMNTQGTAVMNSNAGIVSDIPTTDFQIQPVQQNRGINPWLALGNIGGGMSTENSTFRLGQSLAFNSNNPYATRQQKGFNTLKGIGAGAKTLTSLLRTGFAGAANQSRENEAMTDYYNRQSQADFVQGYENGGQISQQHYLTGSYIGEQNPNMPINAEVEGKEFIQQPDGVVQEVVGKPHSQGGVPVALQEGTRVISDNLKLGGKAARELKKEYDIDVKADHTYADAIAKYKKKIGLEKIDKEQEELFKKLEDKTGIEDESTNAINEQFLAEQIKNTEANKAPLIENLTAFTDVVFQKQEQTKGNDVQLQFENGGTYTTNQLKELYKKHNLTEEQGQEIIKYATGGITGNPPFYNRSTYALPEYGNQPFGTETYVSGNVTDLDILRQRLAQQANLLPNTLRASGLVDENGQVVLNNPEAIRTFQERYNRQAEASIKITEANPDLSAQQKQEIIASIRKESFSTEPGAVNSIDGIAGNFTTSRGTINNPLIKQSDLEKYPNLQRIGDVIDPKTGEINPKYSKLDPSTVERLKQAYKLGGEDSLDIGLLPTTEPAPKEEIAVQEQLNVPQSARGQFGGLNLIDQTLPPPSGLQAARMPDAQYRNYEAIQQTADPQLQQLYNQQNAQFAQLDGLSPALRAAQQASLAANTAGASNQVLGQVNSANQQEMARIGNMNTDLFNRYGIVDNQERELFEQKTYRAMANTENDLNNWYQYNNQLSAVNQLQTQQANTLGNLFPNTTFTPDGRVVSNGVQPVFTVNNSPFPLTPTTKKKTTKK